MRKQAKKILSIVMSAAMALSLGAGVDMTKASAADTLTDIESIEYNMTVSNLEKAGEVKVTATDGAWANPEKTFSVDKDGDYTVKLEGLSKSLANVGFFNSETKMNINVTSIVINGKYKMTMDAVGEINPAALDPTSDKANGMANIWNDAGKAKVVAKGDGAYLSFDQASGFIVMYVDPTAAPADPSAAPSADPSAAPSVAPSADPSAAPADPSAAPTTKVPTAADLVGTAQLDSQANGWCGNEDCTNVKAEINGLGTYVVSSTWDEIQDDPQAYCAMRIEAFDEFDEYIQFSDVTVWVDGKVCDIPLIIGGDGDCRIQLWNTWVPDPTIPGCAVPECLDGVEFSEIKMEFTISIRETPYDKTSETSTDKNDTSLITKNPNATDYEYVAPGAVVTPDPGTTPAPSPAPTVTKNPAKSVKAAKKSVTVKKGKKVNVTFKVKATDNKKKTTDKVKATSSNKKVAKVVKTTVKPGKVVVSVKGVKKGSAKITLKVGSKKATVKVKVKK